MGNLITFDKDFTEDITSKSGTVVGKRVILSEFAKKSKRLDKGVNNNPIVPGAADYIQNTLYDRYTSAAGAALATTFQWFTIPQGQSGKTKTDTNLTLTQMLPAPQWFNVIGLGVYFSPLMIVEDVYNFTNGYWLEFWVQSKIYAEGPVQFFPSPGGLSTTWSFATAANRSIVTNGSALTTNFFDLRLPQGLDLGGISTDGATGIIINGGQTFHVDAKSPAGITLQAASAPYGGFNALVTLQGIHSREVQ